MWDEAETHLWLGGTEGGTVELKLRTKVDCLTSHSHIWNTDLPCPGHSWLPMKSSFCLMTRVICSTRVSDHCPGPLLTWPWPLNLSTVAIGSYMLNLPLDTVSCVFCVLVLWLGPLHLCHGLSIFPWVCVLTLCALLHVFLAASSLPAALYLHRSPPPQLPRVPHSPATLHIF